MDLRDILIAPLITEKSMEATVHSQYTFKVHARATKTQVRDAVTEIFGVHVIKVNTVLMGGKMKTFARRGARTTGKRVDWKKAVVTVKPGETIELDGVNFFQQ